MEQSCPACAQAQCLASAGFSAPCGGSATRPPLAQQERGGEDAPPSEPLACLEEDGLLKGGNPEAIGLL